MNRNNSLSRQWLQDCVNYAPAPIDSPVLIYGSGKKGREILALLRKEGFDVRGFVDSSINGTKFVDGIPVNNIEAWRNSDKSAEHTLVIGIHNPNTDISALIRNISDIHFRRIVTPVEIHDIFNSIQNHFWLTNRRYYAPHIHEFEALQDLFADDYSRDCLNSIISLRIGNNYTTECTPDIKFQYAPRDIPPWPNPLRLIDCGAYNGDTLAFFIEAGYRLDAAIALEPDPANYKHLISRARTIPGATCLPCGVGKTYGALRFSSVGDGSSRFSDDGEIITPVIGIDESLPGFKPNLIKMDIEGAEIDALEGAAETIRSYRPGLAISVYHHPDHLWKIPRLIASWSLDYRFYLRTHAYSTFDTVLYAI